MDKLEAATQSGIAQGFRIERRAIIENLLIIRFNSLDDKLRNIIEPMLSLYPQEFSSLLLQLSQLSRDELLAIFSSES